MLHIQEKEGITQKELLFHLLRGLKVIEEILTKYPEEIQLKEITFTFSIKKVKEKTGKVLAIVGFEKSATKEFNEVDTSTYEYGKKLTTRYEPSKFDWGAIGFNMHLEFAGQIMRDIADEIIAARLTGLSLKSITIERSYSVSKNNNGLLELKFFNDLVDVSANRKSSEIVTNNIKIQFGTK